MNRHVQRGRVSIINVAINTAGHLWKLLSLILEPIVLMQDDRAETAISG